MRNPQLTRDAPITLPVGMQLTAAITGAQAHKRISSRQTVVGKPTTHKALLFCCGIVPPQSIKPYLLLVSYRWMRVRSRAERGALAKSCWPDNKWSASRLMQWLAKNNKGLLNGSLLLACTTVPVPHATAGDPEHSDCPAIACC
jgi:hypothetical protein